MIWRLDRLGRSLRDLIDIVGMLDEKRVAIRSMKESIDTSTAAGRMVTHVFGALAQFERELIVERTHAGLTAARARGRVGGRRPVLTGDKLVVAQHMWASHKYTLAAIATTLGCSRATVYRALRSPPSSAEAGVARGGD